MPRGERRSGAAGRGCRARLSGAAGRVVSCLREGEAHALVAAVLPGSARRDPLDADAEPEPPDRELRETVGAPAGKGDAVVGADRGGDSALPDQPVECRDDRGFRPLRSFDREDEARALGGDDERMAQLGRKGRNDSVLPSPRAAFTCRR